jgi:hypothetical protein
MYDVHGDTQRCMIARDINNEKMCYHPSGLRSSFKKMHASKWRDSQFILGICHILHSPEPL